MPSPIRTNGPKRSAEERAVRRDLGQPGQPAAGHQRADQDERTGAEPGHQARRHLRTGGDQQCLGQEGEARLQRAVAQHVLHVERLEVPGAEQGPEHHQHHGVAAGDGAGPEDAQRDQRGLREPGLQDEEDGEEHDAERQGHQDLRRSPRVGLGAHEGEDQGDEARRHRDRTAQVEVPVHHVRPRLGEVRGGPRPAPRPRRAR